MFSIVVTEEAEQDIQSYYEWWRDHRSPRQAVLWFDQILDAIQSLQHLPERCMRAPEAGHLGRNLRQLLFTTGQRITHRIIFLVDSNLEVVKVLRVRHVSQDALPDDFFDDPGSR